MSTLAAATATTTAAATAKLVKMASGEYTAASVAKDPTDAAKLGLVREKDGNYGTQSPQAASAPAARSSSAVQGALTTLTLGGG